MNEPIWNYVNYVIIARAWTSVLIFAMYFRTRPWVRWTDLIWTLLFCIWILGTSWSVYETTNKGHLENGGVIYAAFGITFDIVFLVVRPCIDEPRKQNNGIEGAPFSSRSVV
ncbi:hypothetical protein MY11210_002260 [Beauveria gryllotalpidicola]